MRHGACLWHLCGGDADTPAVPEPRKKHTHENRLPALRVAISHCGLNIGGKPADQSGRVPHRSALGWRDRQPQRRRSLRSTEWGRPEPSYAAWPLPYGAVGCTHAGGTIGVCMGWDTEIGSCQTDKMAPENIGLFPFSSNGQRNGRRAPHPSDPISSSGYQMKKPERSTATVCRCAQIRLRAVATVEGTASTRGR